MERKNSTELFNEPLIPAGGLFKITLIAAALAIVCGLAAWLAEYNAGMRPDSQIGETSILGCIAAGAIFGCAIGWLWAKKTSLDRPASGK